MTEAQQYRVTRQLPLVRIETFCRSLEKALAEQYPAADLARLWRLYISAECPICGIPVCGEELRALAFPPCAELASPKIGRMRLGDCARRGCNAWHYNMHFWQQEAIDWPGLIEAAERPVQETVATPRAPGPQWLAGLKHIALYYAPRVAAMLLVILGLWLARQLYQGGRIPFFREPEQFTVERAPLNPTWPKPLDGSERTWN